MELGSTVVQLLEQIAEKDGNGKHKHAFGNAAVGQGKILLEHCSDTPLLFSSFFFLSYAPAVRVSSGRQGKGRPQTAAQSLVNRLKSLYNKK